MTGGLVRTDERNAGGRCYRWCAAAALSCLFVMALLFSGDANAASDAWATTVIAKDAKAKPGEPAAAAPAAAVKPVQKPVQVSASDHAEPAAPAAPEAPPPDHAVTRPDQHDPLADADHDAAPPAEPAAAAEQASGRGDPMAKRAPQNPLTPPAARPAATCAAPDLKAIRSYCRNIVNPAADARTARQKKMLEDLGHEIDARVAKLNDKIEEYKVWLARRDEFSRKARDSLVSIYSLMKADAAALQLAELDEETASAVIAKLETRTASAILNEMETRKGARLMQIISGASRIPPAPAAAPQKSAAVSPEQSAAGAAISPETGGAP